MPRIYIETYYDIGCDHCGKHWSTDFNMYDGKMSQDGMGMATNKVYLYNMALKSGWRYRSGKTLCPDCVKELGYDVARIKKAGNDL